MKTIIEPGKVRAPRRGHPASVRRWLFQALLPLFLLLTGSSAFAYGDCDFFDGNDSVSAGNVTTPANESPGTRIGTTILNSSTLNCRDWASPVTTNYTSYSDLRVDAAPVSGFDDVYPTNLEGVGVRYTVSAPECSANDVILRGTGATTFSCAFNLIPGTYQPRSFTIVTEFVRTSTVGVTPGALTSIPKVKITLRSSDMAGAWAKPGMLSGAVSGSISAGTCTIAQNNLVVDLGEATASQFQAGVGTTGASKSFKLTADCQKSLNVFMTLTDAADISNRTDVLKMASGATAEGIGVQVLRSGSPVKFGPDSAASGNTNQFYVGPTFASGGTFNIPLTARYIRTGALRAGTLKAVATFTLSYQ
ncbi:fimbrial protein [Variovorax dokdonensis]|uniref:Fimbrial protein n=1 Tax=Variovorax dokdonensis TaxID=344883 RepID=A0ABT7N8P0_9BURK|nr:fimbrial protein [Variovorax dokdonensis]MDM0044286.1 fimbrial protein [Variovorax dokdonensis]